MGSLRQGLDHPLQTESFWGRAGSFFLVRVPWGQRLGLLPREGFCKRAKSSGVWDAAQALTSPQFLQLMVPPGLQSLKTLSMTTGSRETV